MVTRSDKVLPIEANSGAITQRYQSLGGEMELIVIPGKGHEYDSGFFEAEKMLQFILQNCLDE